MNQNQSAREEQKSSPLMSSGILKIKLFLAVLLSVGLTAGHTQTLDKAKLDQLFDQLHEKNKAMGSITIRKNSKPLYSRSIGYSQLSQDKRPPLTEATRYRVGSVTKMFTATMILQLVEEGTLKLTDHVDKFFPQVPNANNITIANLLAHRSGVHDISEDQEFRVRRLNGMTQAELLALIVKSKPDFEPDAKYAYSNTGFQLLGMLIEKVTGKPYQQVLMERITAKVMLPDTYMGVGNVNGDKNESRSYRYGREWEPQPETHMSLLFGSGAVVSTVKDMAIFIEALFAGKLLSAASLKEMTRGKLGIDTFTYHGKTFYGHTGGIDGFGAWLVYSPEEKLALSYATNGKVYPVANIIDHVFDIYWNKPFTVPSFETMTISTDVLDSYVGVYSPAGAPVKFTVSREGDRLFVQMAAQSPIPLEPTATDKFKIESAGIVFEFEPVRNQMIIKRNGGERVLTRIN